MIISVDGVEIFRLTDAQKQVIKDGIPSDIFESEMKRCLQYSLISIYEHYYKKLREEWEPKLSAAGIALAPTDPDAYAQLIFSQHGYKDKTARDTVTAAQ
jgi:hypothetical protein